jgi:hypothetical protein
MHTFETPAPVSLHVRTGGGRVSVTADETVRTTVELTPLNTAGEDAVARATVVQRGDTVLVNVPGRRGGFLRESPAVAILVHVPDGGHLDLQAESSDLTATGRYADVTCVTGSGDIDVERVLGPARLKSGSGDVSAGKVDGVLVATTGSGNVSVEESGEAATMTVGSGDISIGELSGEVVTKTGSGDVEVGRLAGSLVTKTGSGDVTVRRAASGSLRAKGASGNITVGIAEGTCAWLDVSTLTGRVSQELGESAAPADGQHRVEITAHTVSGDLRVHRS